MAMKWWICLTATYLSGSGICLLWLVPVACRCCDRSHREGLNRWIDTNVLILCTFRKPRISSTATAPWYRNCKLLQTFLSIKLQCWHLSTTSYSPARTLKPDSSSGKNWVVSLEFDHENYKEERRIWMISMCVLCCFLPCPCRCMGGLQKVYSYKKF